MAHRPKYGLYYDVNLVKEMYNSAIRVAYPCVLLFFTILVILGFVRLARKREELHRNSFRTRQERRRERSLFCLMIAVVVLTFVQVIPREMRRIIENFYPLNELSKKIEVPELLTLNEAISTMNLMVLHSYMAYAANMASSLDRSLKFYLYFGFNKQFRKETLNVLGAICGLKSISDKTGYSQMNSVVLEVNGVEANSVMSKLAHSRTNLSSRSENRSRGPSSHLTSENTPSFVSSNYERSRQDSLTPAFKTEMSEV